MWSVDKHNTQLVARGTTLGALGVGAPGTDMLGRTGRGKVHFGDHAGWGSAEFLTKFGKTLGQFEAKTGEFQKVDFYFCCGISDLGCYHGILEKQHLADGHLKSTISLIIQKQANFKCGNL